MDFYFGNAGEGKIILDAEESNHLVIVRRSKTGDIVHVTDGQGHLFTTELLSVEKRKCILGIRETITEKKNPFHLHIAIAPTKNIERIEWFLEKATETGIDEITFLLCRHSERKEIKEDRLRRVMISALKQSMKTFLPKINRMIEFKKFISSDFPETKLICTMNAGEKEVISKYYHAGDPLTVLIGPEGDFHSDEIAEAMRNNFQPVTLGKSRLRTETAAINVCTLFNFINS